MPLELHFIRGEDNVVADALSRDISARQWTIIDLCSGGSCALLTSIARMWRSHKAEVDVIFYRPIEKDTEARMVLSNFADQLRREGCPLEPLWDFSECVDDDVKMMITMATNGHGGVLETLSQADLVFGGPPCQPWSRAGLQGGFDDARDLWGDLIHLHEYMGEHSLPIQFVYECSMDVSNPTICNAKERIDEALGVEGRHVICEYGQRRERIIWSSTVLDFTGMERATWADRLQAAAGSTRAATPSLDREGKPRELAPALTATIQTYSEVNGKAHVNETTSSGKVKSRPMTKRERAAIVGVDPGLFAGLPRESWWRLMGNAVPRVICDVICSTILGRTVALQYETAPVIGEGKQVERGFNNGEAEREDSGGVRAYAPTLLTGKARAKIEYPTEKSVKAEPEVGTLLLLGPKDEKLAALIRELTAAVHVQHLHPGSSGLEQLVRRIAKERGLVLPKALLDTAVRSTTQGCTTCRLTRSPKVEPFLRRKPFVESGEPMREVEIDECCMGIESDGYTGWVTIVDRLTGYVSCLLMKQTDSTNQVIRLLESLFFREGFPDKIFTDEGSRWTSKRFKAWCEERGIKHEEAPPHHHQRQGTVERAHGLLKRALRAGLHDEARIDNYYDQSIWSALLPACTAHLNDLPRRSLPSRNQAYLGRDIPCDGLRPPRWGSGQVKDVDWGAWKAHVLEVFKSHHEKIVAAQPSKKELELVPGDRVFLIRQLEEGGPKSSLDDKGKGPYRVMKAIGNDGYELRDSEGKLSTRHRRHILKAEEDITLGSEHTQVQDVLDRIETELNPKKGEQGDPLQVEEAKECTSRVYIRHYLMISRIGNSMKGIGNCVYGLEPEGEDCRGIENLEVDLEEDAAAIRRYVKDWGPIPLRGQKEGLSFPTMPYPYRLAPRQMCRRTVSLRGDKGQVIEEFKKFGPDYYPRPYTVHELTRMKIRGLEGILEDREDTRLAPRLRKRAAVAAPAKQVAEDSEGSVMLPQH